MHSSAPTQTHRVSRERAGSAARLQLLVVPTGRGIYTGGEVMTTVLRAGRRWREVNKWMSPRCHLWHTLHSPSFTHHIQHGILSCRRSNTCLVLDGSFPFPTSNSLLKALIIYLNSGFSNRKSILTFRKHFILPWRKVLEAKCNGPRLS